MMMYNKIISKFMLIYKFFAGLNGIAAILLKNCSFEMMTRLCKISGNCRIFRDARIQPIAKIGSKPLAFNYRPTTVSLC